MDAHPGLLRILWLDVAGRLFGSHSNRVQHSKPNCALSNNAIDCGRIHHGDWRFDFFDGLYQRPEEIDAIERES